MNDLEFQKTDAGREFAIAAILFGLPAIFLVLLPFVGIWATIPAGLSILFSLVGLLQARKSNGKKGLLFSAFFIAALSISFVLSYDFFFSVNTPKEMETIIVEEKVIVTQDIDSVKLDSISKQEMEKALNAFEEDDK